MTDQQRADSVALTFLELAGSAPPMPFFDAESLAKTVRGGTPDANREVFSAFSMGRPMIREGYLRFVLFSGRARVRR